jgi:hypothetical protein
MGLVALIDITAEAATPSRVPFYVLGSVLVVWAIGLSLVGMSRPDFPGTRQQGRLVMLVSVALFAGALGSAILTS